MLPVTMSPRAHRLYLFGGDQPWNPLDWTSSDDRVRGGSSYSNLSCNPQSSVARFHGNLDIETLGGAGFASQRTTGEDRCWDLSSYVGLELDIQESDDKQYTVILKDELLPKSPNGREQSTVSWEYDFQPNSLTRSGNGKVFFKFEELKATYRGREKTDAEPLDLKNIKTISLMMRSFFGTQQGDFSLSITSLSAKATSQPNEVLAKYHDDPSHTEKETSQPLAEDQPRTQRRGGWFSSFCIVS